MNAPVAPIVARVVWPFRVKRTNVAWGGGSQGSPGKQVVTEVLRTTIPFTFGAGVAATAAALSTKAAATVAARARMLLLYPKKDVAVTPGAGKVPAPGLWRTKAGIYDPKKVITLVTRSALSAAAPYSSIGKARNTTLYVSANVSASG